MREQPTPGTKIRLTSAFLSSTGQSRRDEEGRRVWTVLACGCGLCAGGKFACTDQEHDAAYRLQMWGDLPEAERPRFRHLAVANVEAVGKPEPEPRAEIAWWATVVPVSPYPGHESVGPRELRTRILCHRGEVFWRWCGYLWMCWFAHGSELAEALGTGGLLPRYPTGDPDNCASADRLLAAAEEAGWIRRASRGFDGWVHFGAEAGATPTQEQMFFGADGAFGEDVRKKRCPRLFGWEPVRDSALRGWLGLGCDCMDRSVTEEATR